jgi:putative ABC transport system permease protein
VRALARTPGVSLVIIATLALGIGANAAIFSVIRAVLLAPPPYDAERLVRLRESAPSASGRGIAVSGPNFQEWAQQNRVFDGMAAVTGGGVTLSGIGADPVYAEARMVSASYFDVLGLRPLLGRTFAPDEDQPEKMPVVVIAHRLWVSQFGSDPRVIGREIRVDRRLRTIVGVMPPDATVEVFDPAVWIPADLARGGVLTRPGRTSRDTRDLLWVVARMKPGTTLERATSEMATIAERLARTYPTSNKGWGVAVEPWPRPLGEGFDRSLYLLFGAVAMVLMIGCANVANLALARGAVRARDLATRVALGAGRGRLLRQLLAEHLVIAIAGGVVGLAVGAALLRVMTVAIPSTGVFRVVPSAPSLPMNAPVWLFALALSVLCGVIFGLGPAIGSMRRAAAGAIGMSTNRVTDGRSQRRVRASLVVAEVALAFVLLAGAGLLMRSLFALQQQIGIGFDSTGVLTARLPIPPGRFADSVSLNAYLDRVVAGIQAVPGVRDVAITEGLPTQGTPYGRSFQIAGRPRLPRAQRPGTPFKVVTPSYFRALQLRIVQGRALSDRDRSGAPLALVVNETFARTYFAGVNPIGQHLLTELFVPRNGVTDDAWEVVGVVADEGLSWEGKPEAMVYAAREQTPSGDVALVVRGAVDPARLQEPVRKAVSSVDSDQALTNVEPLERLKTEFVASDRLRSMLLGTFAAVALALAALGLYGVLSHGVAERRREIGIRAALGADASTLVALVVRQGMMMTGCGLALGLAGALATGRLLSTLTPGIVPSSMTTLAMVAGMLTAVALGACYVPARRAARVDPSVTFRAE